MKQKFLFTTVIFICLIGIPVGLASGKTVMPSKHEDLDNKIVIFPSLTPIPTPILESPPKFISIPDLQINTQVESVGQIDEGRVGVPTLPTTVGWYQFGPKPGEVGNAVIDGHYDTSSGAPAIFYTLNTLQRGSIVSITTEQGKTLTFRVSYVASYPTDNFPFDVVFEGKEGKHLNLITCGGSWNHYLHDYSHRTVVFSDLIE